jgi:hypothetical protein
MDRQALMKSFSEGQEFTTNLPVTIRIIDKQECDQYPEDNYLSIAIELQEEVADALSKEDEGFVNNLNINIDTSITPEALLTLIPKERAKINAKYKKELQAKIKALQVELNSF